MTNSSNSDLTREQQDAVDLAYAEWLRRESAMRTFQQAEERWVKAFERIWDNNDGDGPMWAEYLRLKDERK